MNIYVIDVSFVLDVLGHAGRTRNLNSDTNIVRKEMSHRSPDTSAARPPAASHKASPGTQTHTVLPAQNHLFTSTQFLLEVTIMDVMRLQRTKMTPSEPRLEQDYVVTCKDQVWC